MWSVKYMQLVRILNLPDYPFSHLMLLSDWGPEVRNEQNHEHNAWDGHSDAMKDGVDGDVDDHFDDDVDDIHSKS